MPKFTDSDGRLNRTGIYLKEYRKDHRLSIREFSAFLQLNGLDWDYHIVHRTESGQRIVSDLEVKRLSHILQVPVEVLIGWCCMQWNIKQASRACPSMFPTGQAMQKQPFLFAASSVLMDGFCKTACWDNPKPLRFTLRVSCAFYKNAGFCP